MSGLLSFLWRNRSRVLRGSVIAALAALSGACGEGERSIEYDGFVLTEEPGEPPRVFPEGFMYPGARAQMSGVYTRSPYASTREGVLILESTDAIAEIQVYYLLKLQELGWQIIQSHEEPGEVFLLAENLSRRLFTVILRSSRPGTTAPGAAATAPAPPSVEIKMYIKQAGLQ